MQRTEVTRPFTLNLAPTSGFRKVGNSEVSELISKLKYVSRQDWSVPAAQIADPYMDRFFGTVPETDLLTTGQSAALPINETQTMQHRVLEKPVNSTSRLRKRGLKIGTGIVLAGILAGCTQSSSSSHPESSGHGTSSKPSATASRTPGQPGGRPIGHIIEENRDNYVGYEAVVGDNRVVRVAGSTIVPNATCDAADASSVAFIGIASNNIPGEPADIGQEELEIQCPFRGSIPHYSVYAEVYPNAPHLLTDIGISLGDELDMTEARTARGTFVFSVTDRTSGAGSKNLTLSCPSGESCDGNIAEAIVERERANPTDPNFLPLPTLGPVQFDNLQVTTVGGAIHRLPYYRRHHELVRFTMRENGNGRILMSASTSNSNGDFDVRQPR